MLVLHLPPPPASLRLVLTCCLVAAVSVVGEARLRGGLRQRWKACWCGFEGVMPLSVNVQGSRINPVQAVHTPTNDGDSYNNDTAMMGDVQQPHNNGGDGDDNLRSDDNQAVGEGDGDGDLVQMAAAGGTRILYSVAMYHKYCNQSPSSSAASHLDDRWATPLRPPRPG
ncbi:hypothetical protein EI94DRAFT_1857052 [Lactarius quietus]|nr:hypothetical protein EI94DRAFT_1857052 [Lactarius quietus]